jgi:DNA-binding transcriptional ArsR family regulator
MRGRVRKDMTHSDYHAPMPSAEAMDAAAHEAAAVLKMLSNPHRLRLLCALLEGERSVSELESVLGASQSYVSGQLARLRDQGLVSAKREGRIVRYALSDPRVTPIIERLYDVFCP